MSEKTLSELAMHRVIDARARRAEATERLSEAWLALGEDNISMATWDVYVQALAAYKDAREAVRKLEAGEFEKAKEACNSPAGEGET